jgi:hypothetical protein
VRLPQIMEAAIHALVVQQLNGATDHLVQPVFRHQNRVSVEREN